MRFLLPIFLFLAACTTTGPIKEEFLEKPEAPKSRVDEVILDHGYFTISYNKSHRLANWVKYTLKKEDRKGPGDRKLYKRFSADPLLRKMGIPPVIHDDYTNSTYHRGHLAPAEDFTRSQVAVKSTFIMSNVIPQKVSVNSGSWAKLEKAVNEWACGEEKITVITGPVLTDGLPKIKNSISIPREFFKVVIDETPPKKAIAFIYDQSTPKQSVTNNRKPLSQVVKANHLSLEVTTDSLPQDWNSCK